MSNAIAIPGKNNWPDAPISVFVGQIGSSQASVCDARELHAYLQNGDKFADWIKVRIEKYGFEEGRDFHRFSGKTEKPRGGRPSIEYHLSIDMTKELGMVENNERGRRIRRYFIECEKKLRALAPSEADTVLRATIGTDGFHCLKAMLDGKVRHLPAPARKRAKQHVWSQVHKAFSVVTAEDIPASSLDAARNFIAAYAIEGEWLPKEEKPNQQLDIHFPVDYLSGRRPGMQHPRNESTDYLNVSLLDLIEPFDSPCEAILSRLGKAGYNVDGAWWEIRTYRNKIGQLRSLLENFRCNFEGAQQYVIKRGIAA
jgi:phage anti-repressor protein